MEELSIHTIDNAEHAVGWRREVIVSVFGCEPTDTLLDANRRYYQTHLPDGSHIAVEARMGDNAVGCGGMCLSGELPSPDNPSGLCAYIMNIYVREPWRRHGIGHAIVGRLVGTALGRGCGKIYLETTPQARSMYSSLGFVEMTDMMKYEDSKVW